ncbi:MAG: molybdopterin dinucleotide binding domain-containing protein, partial [Acidimicrobiales bacterium]
APARRPGPSPPPSLTFTSPEQPTELPAPDAYGLRLIASRTMYDRGTLVQHAASLAKLAGTSRLRMNLADLTRLGLNDGGPVNASSPRGKVALEAVPDAGVPEGSAALHVNHEGADPADLIDIASPVTTIRVETTRTSGDSSGDGRTNHPKNGGVGP